MTIHLAPSNRHVTWLVLALPLLTGCWKSEATKKREVFDCALTGQTAACLQARYGWEKDDALVAAFIARNQ